MERGEHWPGPDWHALADPAGAGWSAAGLERVRACAEAIGTDALMLVQGGRTVFSMGDLARRYLCHSIRKSFLSALIGLAVEEGSIDLAATLDTLGIDDKEGLSEREKLATVYDLLTARSGVYHPAGFESPWMRSIKEARGTHGPGTFWCYSNWDFNALGTIYSERTGLDIHEAFRDRIAAPLGMEDFRQDEERRDGWLAPDPCSDHPAYPFRLSARDLARFGLLYLRGGRWRDARVVPASWVAESVLPLSDAGPRGAYGYMWWVAREGTGLPGAILPAGSYSAQGVGGHYCLVIPPLDLIVVHRVDTDIEGRAVERFAFGRLVRLILQACGHRS
ncbi:serine hydrolase domain-containing protein [Marinivivus vitaminiproducens]|uniref:serine hydrolase domain-containing protein n=1 Tax=Marinivivus vitaminiproducens TaxID=3035935 RepID=UPI0027AB4FDE|nr:serine hydrolase [Geminicoccaceae bacterium SCSIO 64248]